MDKKKSLIIIILALILALAVALMIQPKRTTTPLPLKEDQVKNVNFGIHTPNSEEEEKQEEIAEKEGKEDSAKTVINKTISTKQNSNKTVIKSTLATPTFERLEVKEEINKVEEAGVSFDDPGIINDNGVIVVTRDFKLKSPRKYSFKDFGVLAEPPVR